MDEVISNDKSCRISVVMSVYNAENYVGEAVQSILAQTCTDFEFIIIDDGCTDNSIKIIECFADNRIRIYRNTNNIGLTASLNRALDLAKGEFIARMDADDIALTKRLETQLHFLDAHPEIGCCGTAAGYTDREGVQYQNPSTHSGIMLSMFHQNPLVHSTVMWRRKLFEENQLRYNADYPAAEDYELWSRAIFITRFANIKTPLLLYRQHADQVTKAKAETVQASSAKIKINFLKAAGLKPSKEEETLHLFLFNNDYLYLKGAGIIQPADKWIHQLAVHFKKWVQDGNEKAFQELWRNKMFITCIRKHSIAIWSAMWNTNLYTSGYLSFSYRCKFFIKCLLGKPAGCV